MEEVDIGFEGVDIGYHEVDIVAVCRFVDYPQSVKNSDWFLNFQVDFNVFAQLKFLIWPCQFGEEQNWEIH